MTGGRRQCDSFFGSKKTFLEGGWLEQNHVERNKHLNLACRSWHERDYEQWKNMSSFLNMDSASDYSFTIPRSTFVKCYQRFVLQLEERLESGDSSNGLFELIDVQTGRKPIEKKAKNAVVQLTKGLKKVGLLAVFNP